MDEPLHARTLNEVRYYLMVTPCPACQSGPLTIEQTTPAAGGLSTIDARCKHCGQQQSIGARCERDLPPVGPEAELINTEPEPSTLVDLHQWLSVFYMLIESAASQDDAVQTRRLGFQAALCLEEALKFYVGDDELPPEESFTTDTGRDAFHDFPEKFARQRLREMRAKLPTQTVMAHNVRRDQTRSRKRWWRFWK